MSQAAQLDSENNVTKPGDYNYDLWPFRGDGLIPETIFNAEHLDHEVFNIWPKAFNCPLATIRAGLRLHIKKHAPQSSRKSETSCHQLKSLANQFASISQCRSKARELTFVLAQSTRRFGRPSTKNNLLEPKRSFGELLAQGYCYDPDMEDLFNWFQAVAQPKKKLDSERYLTADLLKDGMKKGDCPFTPNSIEFARLILIYASVLSDLRNQTDLVAAAIELGCAQLRSMLTASPTEISSLIKNSEFIEAGYDNPAQECSTVPILSSGDPGNYQILEVEPAVLACIETLGNARIHLEEATEAAINWYGEKAESLMGLNDEKWASAISSMQNARGAHKDLINAKNILRQQESAFWKEISTTIKFDGQPAIKELESDGQLISTTLEISKLSYALTELKPSFYQLYTWQQGVEGEISIATLEKLVASCQRDKLSDSASSVYRQQFSTYAENNGRACISEQLNTLPPENLAALIDRTPEHPWGIGEAIILRAAIDKGAGVPRNLLDTLLNASVKSRRVLLSFVDPETVSQSANLVLIRVVAVERLRTIMLFEPISQILDLTSTLMRLEVIGRTVYDLAELLRTNAAILGSSQDISRLLKQTPNDGEAYNALLSFSKTPSTMHGNYRKLREKARDALDTRALKTNELNKPNINSFLSSIENGELAAEVISELNAEADYKVETRHKEQLARYIMQMEILLRDCLSESQHRPDVRLKSLSAKLKRLHRQLRTSTEVGSIEWLEGQIAEILERPSRDVSLRYPTVVRGNLLEATWTVAETDFASQHIDIPEFYHSTPIYFRDIAASCIYWRSRGYKPSNLEIAQHLFNNGQLSAAIAFGKERNDSAVEEFIQDVTTPIRTSLSDRANSLKKQFEHSRVEETDEFIVFSKALENLEVDLASDTLDLLELVLSDIVATKVDTTGINDRNANIKARLLQLEGGHTSSTLNPSDLEAHWKNILVANSSKRAHLVTVEKSFEFVEYLPPHLKDLIAGFKDENESPERWLDPKTSLDFSDFAHEPSDRLALWAKNAPLMIPKEKQATYIIFEWFIGFIVERALSMHQLDEPSDLASAMDRIFEVSATIVNAVSPADCALQLKDTGELPNHFIQALDSTMDGHIESKSHDMSQAQQGPAFELQVSAQLSDLVRLEKWNEALALCTHSPSKPDDKELREVFSTFADPSLRPTGAVVDNLQAAASWLSGTHELAAQLSESQRLALAFLVLSGAIAADSGEEMPTIPNPNGGWAEILGRSSAFRKMLLGSVPYRTERVLETLISGNLGVAVAEKLWDAATNLNDPHVLRTPVLSFMYDHGGSEPICRLASRHDSAISTRLSQLFELRAVASVRPDLIPVAQSVADQIVSAAKSVPFRNFVKELPTAAHAVKPNLAVDYDGDLCLHDSKKHTVFELPIIVTPNGLVPTKLEASLFDGDEVYFEDGSLRCELSNRPTYFAADFTLRINFGNSWFIKGKHKDGVRIRIRAKTLTGDLFSEDIIFRVRSVDPKAYGGARLSTDTLLDLYPGVTNTPAIEETFIGRHDELELLNQVLISARRPSPVLLTGMRRIGKTSLLFAFHNRLRQPGNSTAITFYLSLAERRVEFVAHQRPVSATLFRAISHGLVRPNLSVTDQNYALCSRIRQRFDGDWKLARASIQECYDEESLSDSLIALCAKLVEWIGAPLERFVLLIDEAEALVAPYQAGGEKKLELEQLLQSLREVSQTTGSIGILLSGSNHINVFAREYKNAFFGSSQSIELIGLKDAKEAAALIAPKRVSVFIQFDPSAIEYAFALCAGMPQFLWQVGATVAHLVRVGSATKRDVRLAIAALIGDSRNELPFKAYEILEPIDSILSLESPRERDLLWMLLYRIAGASSLVAEDATVPFVVDHALAALDERLSWNRRLRSLVDLKILRMESPTTVRFLVPLFGEGFRAKKYWQEYNARLQGAAQ